MVRAPQREPAVTQMRTQLEMQRDELRAALTAYGQHKVDCELLVPVDSVSSAPAPVHHYWLKRSNQTMVLRDMFRTHWRGETRGAACTCGFDAAIAKLVVEC